MDILKERVRSRFYAGADMLFLLCERKNQYKTGCFNCIVIFKATIIKVDIDYLLLVLLLLCIIKNSIITLTKGVLLVNRTNIRKGT